MNTAPADYSLFFKFLETYTPVGFLGINRNDVLITELEEMLEENDQFFYIADPIQMKILFTSKRSAEMIGIDPTEVSFYHFLEASHPDDIQRLNLGRAKILKLAQDLFIAEKGSTMLSTNFRMRSPGGGFFNYLCQCYLFYSPNPYKTVFFLKVHTNIDSFKKIKHGYHYFIGDDRSYFRYPDNELLNLGNVFSKREFEIISLVASGLSTEQIAEKLFVSPYTINTHRGNILKKSGKASIFELINDLKDRGLL